MKTEQECFEYLEKISTSQLSENDKAFCEGKLTLQNIWEALNSMKNGKTPGNDGLTKEFYVCFFEELGSLLLNSLKSFPYCWRIIYITKTSSNHTD